MPIPAASTAAITSSDAGATMSETPVSGSITIAAGIGIVWLGLVATRPVLDRAAAAGRAGFETALRASSTRGQRG